MQCQGSGQCSRDAGRKSHWPRSLNYLVSLQQLHPIRGLAAGPTPLERLGLAARRKDGPELLCLRVWKGPKLPSEALACAVRGLHCSRAQTKHKRVRSSDA